MRKREGETPDRGQLGDRKGKRKKEREQDRNWVSPILKRNAGIYRAETFKNHKSMLQDKTPAARLKHIDMTVE